MSSPLDTFDANNRFKTFPLTEGEIIAASKLSELQRQAIKNNIAGYAHDLLNVQYDENKPHTGEFLRSYYRGAIEALEHLIHTDEGVRDAERELETTAHNRFEE